MSRGPDAATLLLRALARDAALAGCSHSCVSADWTRWASATFAGARHVIELRADSTPNLDGWLAGLAEADLAVRGHCVAELQVTGRQQDGMTVSLTIEALTVED